MMMTTIFDFKPKKEELDELGIESETSNTYMKEISRRGAVHKSSQEYEAVCDLQSLAKIRGEKADFEKYTKILDEKFEDITNRIFNE